MGKQYYYAVQNGRNTGVYDSWDNCRSEVNGYSGAVYKKFEIAQDAMDCSQGSNSNYSNNNYSNNPHSNYSNYDYSNSRSNYSNYSNSIMMTMMMITALGQVVIQITDTSNKRAT